MQPDFRSFLEEQRKAYRDNIHYFSREFDKMLFTITAGGFGISIAFIGALKVGITYLIIFSWLLLVVSLFFQLCSNVVVREIEESRLKFVNDIFISPIGWSTATWNIAIANNELRERNKHELNERLMFWAVLCSAIGFLLLLSFAYKLTLGA